MSKLQDNQESKFLEGRLTQYEYLIDAILVSPVKNAEDLNLLFSVLAVNFRDQNILEHVLTKKWSDGSKFLEEIYEHPNLIKVPLKDYRIFREVLLMKIKGKLEEVKKTEEKKKQTYMSNKFSAFYTIGILGSFLAVHVMTPLNPCSIFTLESSCSSENLVEFKKVEYNPTYITNRESNRFTKQEDYLQRTRQIIETGAELIKSAAVENKKVLFFVLLSYFSKERGVLAKDHNTESAEDFGVRRDFKERGAHSLLLKYAYDQCGTEVLSWIQSNLQEMVRIGSPAQFEVLKESHEVSEDCLHCESLLRFELISKEKVEAWRVFKERYDLKNYVAEEVLLKKKENLPLSEEELQQIESAQKKMKVLYPDYEDSHDMNFVLSLMDWGQALEVNEKNSHLVRATVYIKLNGKLQPLTRYNALLPITETWLAENDPNLHPLRLMDKLGVVLLHQDVSLIKDTLDEIAPIFQRIIDWDKKDLGYLQDQMAFLTYLLVHNMRDTRGSAAETEWLIHSIYEALGVEVSVDPSRLQDLEAFSHPMLSDFTKVYKEMTHLQLRS